MKTKNLLPKSIENPNFAATGEIIVIKDVEFDIHCLEINFNGYFSTLWLAYWLVDWLFCKGHKIHDARIKFRIERAFKTENEIIDRFFVVEFKRRLLFKERFWDL